MLKPNLKILALIFVLFSSHPIHTLDRLFKTDQEIEREARENVARQKAEEERARLQVEKERLRQEEIERMRALIQVSIIALGALGKASIYTLSNTCKFVHNLIYHRHRAGRDLRNGDHEAIVGLLGTGALVGGTTYGFYVLNDHKFITPLDTKIYNGLKFIFSNTKKFAGKLFTNPERAVQVLATGKSGPVVGAAGTAASTIFGLYLINKFRNLMLSTHQEDPEEDEDEGRHPGSSYQEDSRPPRVQHNYSRETVKSKDLPQIGQYVPGIANYSDGAAVAYSPQNPVNPSAPQLPPSYDESENQNPQ